MAKSIFDQILAFINTKPTISSEGHYDESMYIKDSKVTTNIEQNRRTGETLAVVTTTTRVEEYIAKQNKQQKAPKSETGVEKYLARKAQETQKQEINTAELTGVARYLAKQAGVPIAKPTPTKTPDKPQTRVEKYLAQQAAAQKPKPATAPKPTVQAATKPAPSESKPAPIPKAKAKPKAPVQKPEKQSEPVAVEKPKKAELIDLSDQASQCQAATNSGTRCKRTTSLSNIQRTIQSQKYQFAVCNQHKSKAFKPFAELIEKS